MYDDGFCLLQVPDRVEGLQWAGRVWRRCWATAR